jgi:uncharacterized protein YdeI (YjbR/CyaY-like superfamily)
VTDRNEWRGWLEKNHDVVNEVWLIYYKKHTSKPRIPYDDAVKEALCFGWIDSIVKRVDDERYAQKFTPRKDGSRWSEAKRRVKELMREGMMTEAGLAKVRAAKESGEWFKSRLRKEFEVPPYMKKALTANKRALENFNKLAPSYKRNLVGWVSSAKREETRKRRLKEAIRVLERGEKLGMK